MLRYVLGRERTTYNDSTPFVHMVEHLVEGLATDVIPVEVNRTVCLEDLIDVFSLVIEGNVDTQFLLEIFYLFS